MPSRPIIPIVLSGGAGTRLWPLSRESQPKQFLRFGTRHSLFQETLLRCSGSLFDARPIVVSAQAHRLLVATDLEDIKINADVMLEPMRRDSCAAIVAGVLHVAKRDPKALVLVLAADHRIPDVEAFCNAVASAVPDAEAGHLVTFGIVPREPATGYGYIKPGAPIGNNGAAKVERFVEKPDRTTAETYVTAGYLWNSGNFLFRADVFLNEAEGLAPEVVKAVRQSLTNSEKQVLSILLHADTFAQSPQISVDFAIMEKTKKLVVKAVNYDWSDIGSWEAVWQVMDHDSNGNATEGKAVVVSGLNNLVHSEGRLTGLVGVDDLIVVTTPDAVLVTKQGKSEGVKTLVAALRAGSHPEADNTLKVTSDWGELVQIDASNEYRVNRITVKPGGTIELHQNQSLSHNWIVLTGAAETSGQTQVARYGANQIIQIPASSNLRVSNTSTRALVLLETST
jgi:mannose-1-phosphate guanylyltransferase / mannose-6-phosphate isomerase